MSKIVLTILTIFLVSPGQLEKLLGEKFVNAGGFKRQIRNEERLIPNQSFEDTRKMVTRQKCGVQAACDDGFLCRRVCKLKCASLMEREPESIRRFREYLRCKAVQPNPDYESSIRWIRRQAKEIGLEFKLFKFKPPNLFVIVLTWKGTNQKLGSILLNSHIDVVAVDPEKWTYPPFAAFKDKHGNIFGRGTQDSKSIGVQYLEAIRNLKSKGMRPLRNVHVSFVPDEEMGVKRGMGHFVLTKTFKSLKVAFALDEGGASENDKFKLMWTQRIVSQVEFTIVGQSGHAALLKDDTAAEKFEKVLAAMLRAREMEKERMQHHNLSLGDVTTINLTFLKGGIGKNVLPPSLSMFFDIRVTPYWNQSKLIDILESAKREAGHVGVSYKILQKSNGAVGTPLTASNIWWRETQIFEQESGVQLEPTIQAGSSDIAYLEQLGIPGFGFSPMNGTPILAHDNDEYLNQDIFMNGIKIYERLLPKYFNLN